MRLIDANALIAYCDKNWIPLNVDAVNDQPTIEPEHKNGKWIKEKSRGQLYQCSACGNYLDFRGVNAWRGSANYCPNCGADMRGEQDGSD